MTQRDGELLQSMYRHAKFMIKDKEEKRPQSKEFKREGLLGWLGSKKS